ncbi:MAG: DUF4912 domain-containing protein [Myxococcota bacterium]
MRRDEEQALRALRALGHSLAGTLARARRWRSRASEVGVKVMDELVSRLAGHPVRTRSKDLLKRAAQLGAGVLETSLVDPVPASRVPRSRPAAGSSDLGSSRPESTEPLGGPDVRPFDSVEAADAEAPASAEEAAEGVLLLPRDPEWAYVSWRFPFELIGRRAAGMRGAEARLRVWAGDEVVVEESVTPAHGRYFFAWPKPGAEYRAQLLIRSVDGREVELGHAAPLRLEGAPVSSDLAQPSAPSRMAASWLAEAEASPSASPRAGLARRSGAVATPRRAVQIWADPPFEASPSSPQRASASRTGGASAASRGAASPSRPASQSAASDFARRRRRVSSSRLGWGSASWTSGEGARAASSVGASHPSASAIASLTSASGQAASGLGGPGSAASWFRGAQPLQVAEFEAESVSSPPPWPFDPERLARLVDPRSRFLGPKPGGVSTQALGYGLGRPQGSLIPAVHDPLEDE